MKKITFYFLLLFFHNNFSYSKDAWIGISFNQNTTELKKHYSLFSDKGLLVSIVTRGSPADANDLKAGDIIISINDEKSITESSLKNVLDNKNPGDILDLEILRGNNENKKIKIKIGDIKDYNPNAEVTAESEKFGVYLYWPGWAIKTPDRKISKVYFFTNPELVKKYDSKNWIITCLDKRSDLYKKGVRLYDEILKINDADVNLYQYSSKTFSVTIKRDSRVLTFKNLKPIINTPSAVDYICVPEFAELICMKELNKINFDATGDLKTMQDLRLYECCKNNNVSYLPFLEGNEGSSLRIDSLSWLVWDLIMQNNYNDLMKYITIAENDLKKIDDVKKKFPDYKLPPSYTALVDVLTKSNLYAQGFKDDTNINYDEKSNIGRLKNKINDLVNNDIKNVKTLKTIGSDVYYLKNVKEYGYLQNILPKLIQANYDEDKDDHVELLGQFYLDLASTYYDQNDYKNYNRIISDAEIWLKKKTVTPYTRVIYAKILNDKGFRSLLSNIDYLNNFKKTEWKYVDNYLNEFYSLPIKEQQKILELDAHYLYNGYYNLGTNSTFIKFSEHNYDYYLLKALEEIDLRPNVGSYSKIYIYSNLLIGASNNNDEITINRTLLNIKNFLVEAKGKDSHLISVRNNFAGLFNFYRQKEMYAEMNDLINFYEKLFVIKTTGDLKPQDLGNIWFYYTAKSSIERSKGNYEKSLKYLEQIIKLPYFNVNSIISDLRNNKKLETMQTLVILDTLPDLFDGYYKTSNIEKIKELTLLGLSKKIDELNYENLDDILVVSNPIRILNPLFFYYVNTNNNEKAKMIAKFINNNFDKIVLENSTIGENQKMPEDYTYNAIQLIKVNEEKLAYNLYDQANKLVLKKHNDTLYNSIWKSSNTNLNAAVDFLEGSNFIKSEIFFNQAFNTAQIIKNSNFSRDVLKGYLSKKNQDNPEISQYHNLQKELISMIKMEELELTRTVNTSTQDKFKKDFENKKNKFDLIENKLKKTNPEYFRSIKIEGVKLRDIQNKLKDNQAVIDYYFSKDKLAIVIIKKNSYNVQIENININNLNYIKNNIRKSLSVSKEGKLIPYDLKNAFKLNEVVFLNLKKYLVNINYLFIVPDGPLNEIPLHALPKNDGITCTDCSMVEWNFSDFTFNYLASLDLFQDSDSNDFLTKMLRDNFNKIYNEFEINKNLKKIKDTTVIKFADAFKSTDPNKTQIIKNISKIKYLGVGDPDLYLRKEKTIENLNLDRFTALRSLNLNNATRSMNISNIYSPVKGSREEILFAVKIFGEENSLALLKENATETKIKETDLSNFNIIHFATHAEVSGALKGLNEPFLVLSPPKENSEKDNGLLMMNEIMQLNLNADLVILSACNTGSVEDQYSGSYSGLAKAFFVAGAKSVLVSNWPVETIATQKLVTRFIENISLNQASFAENLNLTMKELSKQKNNNSHPIFWAPFVFVGTDKEIIKNLN